MPAKDPSSYARQWRLDNPDKHEANRKRYEHSTKGKAQKKRQAAKFRHSEAGRRFRRTLIERITDDYVRTLLSVGTKVSSGDWPKWLVDLKRSTIKLKRKYGIHQSHRGRIK